MKKKRKGFGLIEIVIVIVIFAIIYGISANNTKQIQRARVDTTAQTLQLFASDMDAVISQLGLLEIPAGDNAESKIKDYLSVLEDEYLSFTFDRTTLEVKPGGFSILTADLNDGFEKPFLFYAATLHDDKRIILASAGTDTVFQTDGYLTGDFEDDIIISVKERK